jgi:hypothetical protein
MSRAPKMIASPISLRKEVELLAMQAYDIESIIGMLNSAQLYMVSVSATTNVEAAVNKICSEFAPYARIQEVLRSKLIMPPNRKDWYLYDEIKTTIKLVKKDILTQDFMNKQDYLRNSMTIPICYTPKKAPGLITERGETKLNKYKPPFWKTGVYITTEVPELYMRFLRHLTNNDTGSINYILDWMAYSVQPGPKNKTFITAIGAQGVGKGVLGKIIAALHGKENSSNLLFASIRKQFNKQFADKTFVFLDEVKRASEDEMNTLKKQEDDDIEIELKGIDSETVENHNNIYIASNNFDSLRLEPDDRRHGIINLGRIKLETVFTQPEIAALHDNDTNIAELGSALMNRVPNPTNMVQGYKSSNAITILNSSAYDWEKFVIDDFCKDFAGKTISCRSAIEFIGHKLPRQKASISINTLKLVSQKFARVFHIQRAQVFSEFTTDFTVEGLQVVKNLNEKRLYSMIIAPLDLQPKYEILTEDDLVEDL